VLAGIGSITLADHENVTEDDLGAQFFISDADVGKNVGNLRPDAVVLY
jgi:ubiquitin-like 1-activating enzyme E1 A